MTRATWADFVRWFGSNERSAGNNDNWARLEVAARFVKTRGEAVAAVLAGTSCMPRGVEEKIERWLDVTRLHGISPPVEQPSAVGELEQLATDMDRSAGVADATRAQAGDAVSEWTKAELAAAAGERRRFAKRVRALAERMKETT